MLPLEMKPLLLEHGARVRIIRYGCADEVEATFSEASNGRLRITMIFNKDKAPLREISQSSRTIPGSSMEFIALDEFKCQGPAPGVGKCDYYVVRKSNVTLVIWPNGPDPRAIEFEEKKREEEVREKRENLINMYPAS